MMDPKRKTGRRRESGGFSFFASLKIFTTLAAAVLLVRCGGHPPEILEVRSRLLLFDDRERGEIYEYLTVAVRAEDRDGPDDLESLALIHDRDELFWRLTADRWSRRELRQENWIAAEGIVAAPPGPLPRGTYRVVVKDYAGRKAETSFRLENPPPGDPVFPSLGRGKGSLELDSPQSEAVLLAVSASGAPLGAFTLKRGANSRESVLTNSQVRSQARRLYLYRLPSSGEGALVSGPYDAGDYLFPPEP